MKIRKLFFGLFLCTSLFFLVACQEKTELINYFDGNVPAGFLEANKKITYSNYKGHKTLTKIEGFDFIAQTNHNEYLTVGNYNKISNQLQLGVYSLFDEKLIVDLKYSSLSYKDLTYVNEDQDSVTDVIVHLYQDSKKGVYSLTREKFIFEIDMYDYLYISVSNYREPNIELHEYIKAGGDFVTKEYEVTYTTDGLRKEKLLGDETTITQNQGISFANNLPLLKDYLYTFIDNQITAYKDDKIIFKKRIPSTNTRIFLFHKYFYYQISKKLPDDASNYTYYKDGYKYLMSTYRIDLTNGKESEIKNFNYYFNSVISILKDGNGEKTLLSARVSYISNRLIVEENDIIFDKNLKPIKNITYLELNDIQKLDNNLFLLKNLVVDEKMNVILDLSNYYNITYSPDEKLISLRNSNNKFGLIDLEGNIIAKFEYRNQFSFHNGLAYNSKIIDNVEKYYFIDKFGSQIEINTNSIVIPQLMIYFKNETDQENLYTYKSFDGKVLFKSPHKMSIGIATNIVYNNNKEAVGIYFYFDNEAYFIKN